MKKSYLVRYPVHISHYISTGPIMDLCLLSDIRTGGKGVQAVVGAGGYEIGGDAYGGSGGGTRGEEGGCGRGRDVKVRLGGSIM